MNYLAGIIIGILCLIPFLKASQRTLVANGYLALAMMLMIYVGAYLVSGNMRTIVHEVFLTAFIMGLGGIFLKLWPVGVGFLILFHAGYDHFFGANSGIVEWYPGLCVGFDIVVGTSLIVLLSKKSKKQKMEEA